jgi:hypothetical protein
MLGYWKVKKLNAPTFFKGEHVAEISSKMRSFYAWQNKISGVIGYYIYKSSSGGAFDSDPINKCIITDTSYVDSNVRKDQTYSYYVTAVNKYEVESEPSDAITIEVKPFESDKLTEEPESRSEELTGKPEEVSEQRSQELENSTEDPAKEPGVVSEQLSEETDEGSELSEKPAEASEELPAEPEAVKEANKDASDTFESGKEIGIQDKEKPSDLSAFIIIALSISLFLVVTVFIVYVIRQKRKIS